LSENKPTSATFNKKERLKSRSTIVELFSQNQSVRIYPFKIVWLVKENETGFSPKIGVSVAKRNFKKAVQRNRIKRQMREAFRLNKSLLYTSIEKHNIQIACMIIYTSAEVISYKDMEYKIKQCLVRLNKTILNKLNS